MDEVGKCIKESSPIPNMLIPKIVANEVGEINVPTYDWQDKFSKVKAVPQLKKYHHFVFDAAQPACQVMIVRQ
jgi:hypothetical protein